MSGIQINRSAIALPTEVSSEIIQKTQEGSAVMQLAREIDLPGAGLTIPVILSDPEAEWVTETGKKPVSNAELDTKIMRGYKLAVIEPFSNEFKRDYTALYNALVNRLPKALGMKFDKTVFGGVQAPGSDFDTFASVTARSIAPGTGTTDSYDALVEADTDIAIHGGIMNGIAISPQGKGILLGERDNNGRPLYVNSPAEGNVPIVFGTKTYLTKGAFISGLPAKVGFAGDWTQAVYGIVDNVDLSVSDQATLELPDGSILNLWQHNMFAVRAEIEIGFRADTSVFNALTAASVPSI